MFATEQANIFEFFIVHAINSFLMKSEDSNFHTQIRWYDINQM
jgi:hypothetical protein